MMTKLKHSFLILCLIALMPAISFAQSPSTENQISTSTYTINKPGNLSNWFITADGSKTVDIDLVASNDSTLNDRGKFSLSEIDITSTELTWLSLLYYHSISELHCDETITVTISGFPFENLTCYSLESDTNALREFTYSYGLVGDKYYLLTEDYGRNMGDKAIIDDIYNNFSFKPAITTKSQPVYNNTLDPSLSLHINNDWNLFELDTGEISGKNQYLFGVKKDSPFNTFSIYYDIAPQNPNITNSQYFDIIEKEFNEDLEDTTINSLQIIDTSYTLNDSEKDVIKYQYKISPKEIYRLNKELQYYTVSYVLRNYNKADVHVTYSFLESDENKAKQEMSKFENEIAKKMTFIYLDKDLTYSDLNIPTFEMNKGLKGQLISPQSNSAVYLVKDDGKRYVFPNEKVYFSWYNNFDSVKQVPDSDLAKYQIGGNINLKPGTMIKITTVPKVYIIVEGNKIAWVENETAAKRLLGNDWNKKVKDVPDALFTNYEELGFSIK